MARTLQAKCLTTQEVEACLFVLNADEFSTRTRRNLLWFLLMTDAGLRVGELVQLKFSDFLVADKFATALRIRGEIAKCQIERVVPLTPRLQAAIRGYYESEIQRRGRIEDPNDPTTYFRNQFAFSNTAPRSAAMTTRQVERWLEKLSFIALGRKVHPHQLRHTFGTNLAAVAQPHVVQELLGHRNLSSTQVYTHANGQDCRNAIDSMGKDVKI